VDRLTFGELAGRALERQGSLRPMYHI
jgi:hypothetical protein